MRLELYSSKTRGEVPNLVGVQDPNLDFLPTVLCCPLRSGEAQTILRTTLSCDGQEFVVLCDLLRPVNRRVLRFIALLNETQSRAIVAAVRRLLPPL